MNEIQCQTDLINLAKNSTESINNLSQIDKFNRQSTSLSGIINQQQLNQNSITDATEKYFIENMSNNDQISRKINDLKV